MRQNARIIAERFTKLYEQNDPLSTLDQVLVLLHGLLPKPQENKPA